MTLLEQYYIKWRHSDDPLANGPRPWLLYAVYNDLGVGYGERLEAAYQAWLTSGEPERLAAQAAEVEDYQRSG